MIFVYFGCHLLIAPTCAVYVIHFPINIKYYMYVVTNTKKLNAGPLNNMQQGCILPGQNIFSFFPDAKYKIFSNSENIFQMAAILDSCSFHNYLLEPSQNIFSFFPDAKYKIFSNSENIFQMAAILDFCSFHN